MINLQIQRYALFALLAAVLFGASTPFAKILLGQISPQLLAGLLYLGSGVGLLLVYFFIHVGWAKRSVPTKQSIGGHVAGAPLPTLQLHKGKDMAWFAAAIFTGGILAPLLLMWGLSHAQASSASLLLNFESAITIFVAAILFREAVAKRIWLAALIMLIAGLLLNYTSQSSLHFSLQSFAIVGACLMWALDNNCTRNIAIRNPLITAGVKGLIAGLVNIGLSVYFTKLFIINWYLLEALLLGFLSYGVSLVLFILALRHLGAARTSAHFSTAPFIGAALSILLLHESFTFLFGAAFVLMLVATWLVLTEDHAHEHTHEYMAHAHKHMHDEHHQHTHRGDEGPEPHAHFHEHEPITHFHPHLPDIHHRHKHK